MKSRERVMLALNHQEPDRIDIQALVLPENIVTMFKTALEYGKY